MPCCTYLLLLICVIEIRNSGKACVIYCIREDGTTSLSAMFLAVSLERPTERFAKDANGR
jgi:hypothetical protein